MKLPYLSLKTIFTLLIIYNIFILFFALAANVASIFNSRIKEWMVLQSKNWDNVKLFSTNNSKEVIWFHCASVGEYEQAMPLINIIKREDPNIAIAVTFFSPSGVEFHKDNEEIDFIGFLPIDTQSNITQWIRILKPSKIIIVKNEWWPNLMNTHIPTYHICVNSIPKTPLSLLKSNGIHITNIQLKNKLSQITNNILVAQDTKIERAITVKQSNITLPEFQFPEKTIIYGSMWDSDAKKIKTFIESHLHYKHIIFPHDLRKENVDLLKSLLPKSNNIIFIEKKGILKHAYKYADHVYIGGGFGNGVHNAIEALIYKKPISIGPNIGANKELLNLVEEKYITQINNAQEFETFINNFRTPDLEEFIKNQKGNSQKIYNFIFNDNRTTQQT